MSECPLQWMVLCWIWAEIARSQRRTDETLAFIMTKTQSDDVFGEICPVVLVHPNYIRPPSTRTWGWSVVTSVTSDASWAWWQRTCYCLSRRIIVQHANNIWMADPSAMWELATVQSQTSPARGPGYQVSGLWLVERRNPGIWLADRRYQCRTLIITFLPGLNIITCLHLSQPGHSNIGSLILANKCQEYSPSLSNVASQQTDMSTFLHS